MLEKGHKCRAVPALPLAGMQWDRDRAPAAASREGQLHVRLAAQGSAWSGLWTRGRPGAKEQTAAIKRAPALYLASRNAL